jgi:hypothetical protein
MRIDGELDEDSWESAISTGNFPLYDGKQQNLAHTSAMMLWDDEYLYIAFVCEDTDLYSTMKGRDDDLWRQDVVEVFIMEQSVGQDHFVEYEVNPTGAFCDMYNVLPYVTMLEWVSPGFKAAAKFNGSLNDSSDNDIGYHIEMAIPFRDLRLRWKDSATPKDGDKFKMNLCRVEYKTPERIGSDGADMLCITWSPTITDSYHRPSRFGVVEFADWPTGKPRPQQP